MTSRPNAQLQHRLILRLARPEPVGSVAALARKVDATRPSTSRALHALERAGLASKRDKRWTLTRAGRQHANVLRDGLLQDVERLAGETARRVEQHMKTIRAADLAGFAGPRALDSLTQIGRLVNSPAALQAVEMLNSGVAQEAMQVADSAEIAAGLRAAESAGEMLTRSIAEWVERLAARSSR